MQKLSGIAVLLAIAVAAFVGGMAAAPRRGFPYDLLVDFERRMRGETIRPRGSAELKARYWAAAGFRDVVIYGDSHVELADWVGLLNRMDVSNRGVSGETSTGLLERIKASSPVGKTVFVIIGTNDVRNVSPSTTAANIRAIVDILQAENRLMLLSTPFNESPARNAIIREIIAVERSACVAPKCAFVDINAAVAPDGVLPSDMTLDGVHLSPVAYERVRDVMEPFLPKSQMTGRWGGAPRP